jgi:hypothetical protein
MLPEKVRIQYNAPDARSTTEIRNRKPGHFPEQEINGILDYNFTGRALI